MIIRKIIKITATRCQISRVKCTEFDSGWGCARPLSWILRSPTRGSGREGKGSKKGGVGGMEEMSRRDEEWRGGEGLFHWL